MAQDDSAPVGPEGGSGTIAADEHHVHQGLTDVADGTSNSFDLVVIGGGTGGYAAAFRGAQLGLRVALVDKYRIGGTCLHVGCIPTKAMLESADLADRIKHASEFGIKVAGHDIDLGVIADRRDGIVEKMTKGLMFLVKKHKVEYIRGTATLQGATTIKVATTDDAGEPTGERVLTSKDTILATGSRTKSLPGIVPDGERILTSDHILKSRDVPASLIVVGAGAVGMEFASFYADMGTQVTVLEYLPAVVPLEDAEVSKEMERAFTKRGIKVITKARFDAASVKADETGVRLLVGKEGEAPAELVAEKMLVATGRAANTENVGLETTKAVVERTLVKVDPATMETAEPHLYAIGDIIGGLWLAHVAAHEGINAVTAITGGEVHPIDYVKMPRATYSRPAGRLDRAHPAGVRAGRHPVQGRQGALPGHRQGRDRGRAGRLRARSSPRRDRRDPGRPPHRDARDRAHRGGVGGDAVRGHGVGGRRCGPSRTRRCPRCSARPPWRSMARASTSSPASPAPS